ncbi:MAG: hypothetical protein IJ196_01245 [Prevotella sp.]|nr:hypothetical protein [Prevotella sp.]
MPKKHLFRTLFLALMLVIGCMNHAWGAEKTWSWTAKSPIIEDGSTFGSNPSFTLKINTGAKQSLNSEKGWQYGSNNSAGKITLTSNANFTNIKSITVNTSVNSSKKGTLVIAVGDSQERAIRQALLPQITPINRSIY